MQRAQGFFTNAATFHPAAAEVWRAWPISQLTGGVHVVVEMARNAGG